MYMYMTALGVLCCFALFVGIQHKIKTVPSNIIYKYIVLKKVTALGVTCCFALLCLTLLSSSFFISHLNACCIFTSVSGCLSRHCGEGWDGMLADATVPL